MMASMGPSFPQHPGMQQHPGVPPGHPGMAPGMAHNPSQPGVQPGGMPHQMHMGVSGPGPQVNPAALMAAGIPPGGGPNPHAMQQLSHQQQLFQQQQMNPMAFANNQALQAQMQQQRLQQLQQHQARQTLMAQQGMYNMNPGMPMAAMQMGQMTPQQAAQFRMLNFQRQQLQQQQQQQPGSQQALIAQQMALQQQQISHNQLAQGHGPNHPGQMNPQLQGIPPAQLAAMQAAQQQQAAQHQQAQQHAAQQQAQQQAAQQQQQQAQAQQQQAQAQQAQQAQQQAQQQPAQTPQGPQQAHTPQPQQGQPGPSPNMPPNAGQAQGPGQQQPNQQAQGPHPANAMQAAQPQQMQLTAAAHQQALTNMMLQNQKRENMKGHCLLKLMQFAEHLSGFPGSRGKDDLSYWNEFVHRFFSPKGIFRHTLCVLEDRETEKQYEIAYPTLARYFATHFDSGVKNIQLIMDKGTTDKPLPNDCHFIENSKASMQYWFDQGTHLVATGTVRAQFDAEQRIELFEFVCTGFEEYVSRNLVIEAAKPSHMWVKDWLKVNADNKPSPEMSKKAKARPMKSPPNPPPDFDLPDSVVKRHYGVTEAVFQFLEVSEIMSQMNPLFDFYHSHPGMGPYQALDDYVRSRVPGPAHQQQQQQQPGHPPTMNGQPGAGPRTPGFGQFPMGASPHAAHLQLPGSPHVGSPVPTGPGGMPMAPAMQMQQSQQGTSSSGPSANTSPAGTKRRRPSGVKTEDDSNTPASAPTPNAGPQVNGIQAGKAKPPTPRMQKRLKTNPAPS